MASEVDKSATQPEEDEVSAWLVGTTFCQTQCCMPYFYLATTVEKRYTYVTLYVRCRLWGKGLASFLYVLCVRTL